MNDQTQIVAGAALGAVLGGLAAYLLLTDEGQAKLTKLQPAVGELSRILQETRTAIGKFTDAAVEGRRAAGDLAAAFGSGRLSEHTWQ
jgi:hypothetical protein